MKIHMVIFFSQFFTLFEAKNPISGKLTHLSLQFMSLMIGVKNDTLGKNRTR
jgi:hypothetical protein